MHPSPIPKTGRPQLGLSLIEILVGIAIGAIAILAIFQTVTVWTKHTLTTSAGSDAQMAGTLALFSIERDLKQAGHGFAKATAPVMGCDVQASGPVSTRAFNFPLSPVTITQGAGGAPDQISVLYGDSSFFVDIENFSAATSSAKTLDRRNGFKRGDLAIVAGNASASAASATCRLVEITNDLNTDGKTVDHVSGTYSNYYSAASGASRYNDVSGTGALFSSGTMYDLGPEPVLNTWKIANGKTLVRSELFQGTPDVEIAENVVNLKAEYGIDTDNDKRISAAEWSASAPADWTRVLALRVALLVRSRQFERNPDAGSTASSAVTTAAPAWAGGAFVMTNVDGSSGATSPENDWHFYRYRVYERVIPFRNRLWN